MHIALEQAPKAFEAIGMNATVSHTRQHGLQPDGRTAPQGPRRRAGSQCRAPIPLNMLLHFGLERVLLAVRNNCRNDLAATLKNAHDCDFVLRSGTSDAAGFLCNMHVPGLAANGGFIRLNLTGQLGGCLMQGGMDTVEHEPRGLLSDAEGASHFAGANAVLAVTENPLSAHPFIESKGESSKIVPTLRLNCFLHPEQNQTLRGLMKGLGLQRILRLCQPDSA